MAPGTKLALDMPMLPSALSDRQSAERCIPLAATPLPHRAILHDLAGLFTAANGYAQVALLDVDPAHPAREALEMLTRVLWRAENASRGLASAEAAGRCVLRPVDPCRLVREAVETAEVTMPPNVELTLCVPADEIRVRADAAQIVRVLLNLIQNSRHALEGVSGRIVVAVERPPAARSDGASTAVVSVRDDGPGMEPSTLRRATECLFSRSADESRTGLGLWMAERVVEAHGGRLEIESARGAGTHVRMHVPLLDS